MITFFYFQETYNSRLRERYGDDPLTHPEFDPDLWIEVGSSGGPDKNRVYWLSNTTAENLRAARSVSTVGSSQSVSSTQSKEFVALQQHRLSSPKNTITYQRSMHNSKRSMHNTKWIMNSFAKWSWTLHHKVVIHVRLILFGRITTSLLLLLLLQLYLYINL